MHGGRWAITGFLYQILGSLGHVAQAAVVDANYLHGELMGLRLSLEPQKGGDLVSESLNGRIVEQFKFRGGQRTWSASEIVEEVLPDLFQDVIAKKGVHSTQYNFTTNGRVVAKPLRKLLVNIASIGPDVCALSELDDIEPSFQFRKKRITEKSFFREIMQACNCCDQNANMLWNFLCFFEINDLALEEAYLKKINTLLSILVEDRSTIEVTRDSLIGQLLRRSKSGDVVTPIKILSTANLNWNILEKRNQLHARLRDQTRGMIEREGYGHSLDSRDTCPRLLNNWFSVLSGGSGQGKTWQLMRLAHDYVEQDKTCLFLRNIKNMEELESEIIKHLWHKSGYDNSLPLCNILERLGDILPKAPEPCLTLFIDDVDDVKFAHRLMDSDFRHLRLQIVLSVQPRVATALEHSFKGLPHIINIDPFSARELRDYFLKRNITWTKIPGDVLELLRQPILAKFYVDAWHEDRILENEYELIHSYWKHVTSIRREQYDHPQDIIPLKTLAMKLFGGLVYPWTQKAANEAGLTNEIQKRLISVGVLKRDDDQNISLWHDRLLNWLVAETIADKFFSHDIKLSGLCELLFNILWSDAKVFDSRLEYKLGYVPMDVLWLIMDKTETAQMASLINSLVREEFMGWRPETIFSELLSTLGVRILPALELFITDYFTDDDSWTFGSNISKGIVSTAAGSVDVLQPLIARLILSDDLSNQRVGLIIAATIPLQGQTERIWELHRQYGFRRKDHKNFEGMTEYSRWEMSFKALARSIESNPQWMTDKLSKTHNEDELVDLVYLMKKVNFDIGINLWEENKTILFDRISTGRRCLPIVVGRFRDETYIEWLCDIEDVEHEDLSIELRFDALVLIRPAKALEFLQNINSDLLTSGTSHLWLRLLLHKLDNKAQEVIRNSILKDGWLGVRNLAILFQGDEDLIDCETLNLIIDTFDVLLKEHDHDENWQPAGEGHLLKLLSNINSPQLLPILEAKRGSRFEELLSRRAIYRGGRNSRDARLDVFEYRSLLLKIGGKGIEDVIVNQLTSDNTYTRSDALECVKWFSSSCVKDQVLKIAKKKDHEKIEEVRLMQALASLVEDDAFLGMLQKGVPGYLDALDIRQSKPPMLKKTYNQLCIDTSSADETVRFAAVVMLSFGKGKETGLFLQKILKNCDPQSKIATDIVWTLDRLGYYTDAILPCLERMMSSKDTQRIVFNYLLRYGGITAEAAIGSYLRGHKLEEITNVEEQVARLLVSRKAGIKEAADFLWRMVNKCDHKYASNQNLLALSEAGDSLATDLLFDKAIADKNFIESPVIAIKAISRRDPEYAFEAAIRLIENDDSMGCEVILLSIDSKKSIPFLLQFLEKDIDTLSRWRIYRNLRWHAPLEELRTALKLVLNNSASRKREVVCEILGWLPFGILDNVLDECVNDNERPVEKAAIQALRKRQEQSDVIQFLSEISNVDGMMRWSRFYAMLNLFDPRALANNSDPLCIWPIVKKLPFEFMLEAEKILEQKVKKEKQKAT